MEHNENVSYLKGVLQQFSITLIVGAMAGETFENKLLKMFIPYNLFRKTFGQRDCIRKYCTLSIRLSEHRK